MFTLGFSDVFYGLVAFSGEFCLFGLFVCLVACRGACSLFCFFLKHLKGKPV